MVRFDRRGDWGELNVAFMLDGAESIHRIPAVPDVFSLVFGNEAEGPDPAFKGYGSSVIIPQTKDVDSLNLAVPVGMAAKRRRRKRRVLRYVRKGRPVMLNEGLVGVSVPTGGSAVFRELRNPEAVQQPAEPQPLGPTFCGVASPWSI